MGCHTWFYRPAKDEEIEFFKDNAIEEAWSLCGKTEENIRLGTVDMNMFERVKHSVNSNTNFWKETQWGTGGLGDSPGESTKLINGVLYINIAEYPTGHIFPIPLELHDVFRVKNYPKKIIHSRKELRRFLRSRYFKLEDWQLEKVSEFFKTYPGGVICFG